MKLPLITHIECDDDGVHCGACEHARPRPEGSGSSCSKYDVPLGGLCGSPRRNNECIAATNRAEGLKAQARNNILTNHWAQEIDYLQARKEWQDLNLGPLPKELEE